VPVPDSTSCSYLILATFIYYLPGVPIFFWRPPKGHVFRNFNSNFRCVHYRIWFFMSKSILIYFPGCPLAQVWAVDSTGWRTLTFPLEQSTTGYGLRMLHTRDYLSGIYDLWWNWTWGHIRKTQNFLMVLYVLVSLRTVKNSLQSS